MKTLMVCSAGTGGGFATILAVRRTLSSREIRLIATDTNPPNLCAASLFADQYYQVPPAGSPDYAPRIGRIIQCHKPDGLVAAVDLELVCLDEILECMGMRKAVRLAVSGKNFRTIFRDKMSIFSFLEQNGFPVPPTVLACDARDSTYIFKPIEGAGSRGVFLGRPDQIPPASDLSRWIAQEVCRPPEITVDVITDGPTVQVLCRERIEVKNGVSVKARIFRDRSLAALGETLARRLDFPYGFCFQVMLGKGKDWVITDLNPRLGAGSAMSSMVGSDFFGANVARILDDAACVSHFFKPFEGEAFVVRQYSEFLTTVTPDPTHSPTEREQSGPDAPMNPDLARSARTDHRRSGRDRRAGSGEGPESGELPFDTALPFGHR